MEATPRRLALLWGALSCLALGLFPSPGHAQGGDTQQRDVAAVLVSTRWCHESSTGLSFHTTKLRFQPNGVMLIRTDTDMANGSHVGKNSSARWALGPGLLIIQEPDGGESRLPIAFAGAGNNMRLTLGNRTYAVCR
jgi:hypothetical protein